MKGWKRMIMWVKRKDGWKSKIWKEVELLAERVVGWRTVDL